MKRRKQWEGSEDGEKEAEGRSEDGEKETEGGLRG
jgi:hypothetical protein